MQKMPNSETIEAMLFHAPLFAASQNVAYGQAENGLAEGLSNSKYTNQTPGCLKGLSEQVYRGLGPKFSLTGKRLAFAHPARANRYPNIVASSLRNFPRSRGVAAEWARI
jgi:hypothetical protein